MGRFRKAFMPAELRISKKKTFYFPGRLRIVLW